jgi:metal-sulfur cluster biosynthetic enzyme
MDPEAGMNIVDLGLIYGIDDRRRRRAGADDDDQRRLPDGRPDRRRCPRGAGRHAAANTPVEIEMVWDPPWTPDRMSGLARDHFGWAPR